MPKQFWKIIFYCASGEEIYTARSHILTQSDLLNQLEILDLPEFSVYEMPISDISEMTGFIFPIEKMAEGACFIRDAETVRKGGIRRIASVSEIVG